MDREDLVAAVPARLAKRKRIASPGAARNTGVNGSPPTLELESTSFQSLRSRVRVNGVPGAMCIRFHSGSVR
jgi:hypothetical protein